MININKITRGYETCIIAMLLQSDLIQRLLKLFKLKKVSYQRGINQNFTNTQEILQRIQESENSKKLTHSY